MMGDVSLEGWVGVTNSKMGVGVSDSKMTDVLLEDRVVSLEGWVV